MKNTKRQIGVPIVQKEYKLLYLCYKGIILRISPCHRGFYFLNGGGRHLAQITQHPLRNNGLKLTSYSYESFISSNLSFCILHFLSILKML